MKLNKMNILISALGATPDIIEETIGIFNYNENVEFYQGNTTVKALRNDLERVDEVWLVATDQKHKDLSNGKQILSLQESFDYICRNCAQYNVHIRIFVLDGVDDIVNEDDARAFHDLLLRVVAYAHQQNVGGKLYLSLACGRKTMSTDMQDAAYIFGCDNLLHVLGDKKEASHPMLMGSVPPNEAIRVQNVEFDSDLVLRCKPSTSFLNDVEEQKQQSQHFYTSYYLDEKETRSNFHILYTLPPSKIKQLKETKLGVCREKEKEELDWLRQLPKSDLHCHLGGALSPSDLVQVAELPDWYQEEFCELSPRYGLYLNTDMTGNFSKLVSDGWKETVRQIANDLSVPRYAISSSLLNHFKGKEDELKKLWYGEYCDETQFCGIGIEKYEKLGDLQGSMLLDFSWGLKQAVKALLERCYSENVKYLEIRCSPFNYVNVDYDFDASTIVKMICKILEQAYPKVETSLIFIISRHRGDVSASYVDLVKQLKDEPLFRKFFRGFDLAGNESIKTPEELRNSFMEIMKECYNITIHAGETESVESIWQAVYHLNAERIGHGLHLLDNEDLLTKFLERGISVELCPSSNFQIVGFRDNYLKETEVLPEYPLKAYLEKELKVSVNTDDPGISLTDMTHELHKAARMTCGGLSKWDILQLICNGFRSAFYPYEQKKQLMRMVEREIGELINKGVL